MELKVLLLILRKLLLESVGGFVGKWVTYFSALELNVLTQSWTVKANPCRHPLHPHSLTARRKGAQGSANPASHPLWEVCVKITLAEGPMGKPEVCFYPTSFPPR